MGCVLSITRKIVTWFCGLLPVCKSSNKGEDDHYIIANDSNEERYIAAMTLGAVGDALGYKNGAWEFNHSGPDIHEELERLGGIREIKVSLPEWMVSDDTVMLIATGKAIIRFGNGLEKNILYKMLAEEYKECMNQMSGREPGITCMNSCNLLQPKDEKGYRIPFNSRGGGCGAAMRAMCIGLRFPRKDQLKDLIAVSVEAGRMTHHHPTGFLGSLATALFASYALQKKPLSEWPEGLLQVVEDAKVYVETERYCVEENMEHWDYFVNKWTSYKQLKDQNENGSSAFSSDVESRDEFYQSLSYAGWGGSSGHDAPMIAYDALLESNGDWEELCNRAMFHGGDSDSTGVIAGFIYGALYGFKGVPENNYKHVEFRSDLSKIGSELYKLSND